MLILSSAITLHLFFSTVPYIIIICIFIKGNVAVYKVLNIEKRHNYAS